MYEKKPSIYKSPDLALLKTVVIDHRTTIYVALGVDSEEAKIRYLSRIANRKP
jgi:hypothetical protein